MNLKIIRQIRQYRNIFLSTFRRVPPPKKNLPPGGIMSPFPSLWRRPMPASSARLPEGAHSHCSRRDDWDGLLCVSPQRAGVVFLLFPTPAWIPLNSPKTVSLIFKILIPLFFSRRDLSNDVSYFPFDENLWNLENLKFQFEFRSKNVSSEYSYFWHAEQLWSQQKKL